jgi:hypothetical protein
LGILLVRGSSPAPPLPAAESQAKSGASALSKGKNGNLVLESAQDNTRILKGPWIASQKHFAEQTRNPCPSEFNTIQPAKKGDAARKKAADKAALETSMALEDGTVRVDRRGKVRSIQDPRAQLWCIPEGTHVQAMIATAPDPVQTHMALAFDRTIEAIQAAAGSMGYLIDYYWLPWDIELKSDWSDYDSLAAAAKERRQREAQPGLLLFRRDGPSRDGKPTVLYVFLVGETSTTGINGEQFGKAVEYIQQLPIDAGQGCQTGPCIHVVGPTFSGSMDSLRRLVDAQADKRTIGFDIKSGTVSSQSAINKSGFGGKATFHNFVRTIDDDALGALLTTLANDGDIDTPKKCSDRVAEVAILSEVGTTFGEALQAAAPLPEEKRERPLCYDVFRYSREIASLRNAYQETTSPGPGAGDKSNPSDRPWLSFSLTDRTNREDEPPDFSKSQSPLSKEAVLMNYAAQMRRNHYRYIGISSSNTLDRIFLVNFLRKAVPDARLLLFSADLLLARDQDNVPYIGTLAVTTHPLVDPSLDGVYRRSRLPFSEDYEVGSYNASVCAIAELIGAEQGKTQEVYSGYPYSCPDRDSPEEQPRLKGVPLWLTAVGTGGYWPVRILQPSSPVWQVGLPKDLPGSWLASATLLCGLVTVHFLVLIGISPFSTKFRDFTLGTVAPGRQLFVIHLASASLALAMVLVSTARGRCAWAALPIVLITLVCAWLTTKYLLWRKSETKPSGGEAPEENTASLERRPTPELVLRIGHAALIPGIWVLAGLLAYWWWELFAKSDDHYGIFFAYRASHLTSVVSPLTPMLPLLATVYVWSICHAWRLRFDDAIRPRLNPSWESQDKHSGEDKLRPGWRSERRIAKAINGQFLTSPFDWCGVAIFMAWFVVFFQLRPFEPFERPNFGHIYGFLFCLAILLILISGFRLAQTWQELRYFLLELRRQRVQVVFTRLKVDWPSIWYYGSGDADWDYMVRSDETIQQLKNVRGGNQHLLLTGEVVSGAVREVRRTRRVMQDEGFLQRVKHTFNPGMVDEKLERLTRHSQKAQEYLAVILNQALDSLDKAWRSQPPWLEEEDNGKKSEDGTVTVHCCKEQTHEVAGWQKVLENYVALRYVAFIRAVLARIRTMLIFLTVSFTLVLISLVIYSFEPHRALIWSVTAIFVLIGFIVVSVLMQIHRNPILSRITGSKAHELGLIFYVRIAALGAAPLLTLLATHFPSIGRYLVSFLQPGLEALK